MASKPPPPPTSSTGRSTGGGTSTRILPTFPRSSAVDPFVLQYIDARVDKVKAEVSADVAALGAAIKQAEAQRSVDYKTLSDSIDTVARTLPTTDFIKSTIRNWVLAIAGVIFGGLALFWAVFDTGAGLTGAFADKVLDSKEATRHATDQAQVLNAKLDRLLAQRSTSSNGGGGHAQTGVPVNGLKTR